MLQKIIRFSLGKTGVETNETKGNSEIVIFKPTHFVDGTITHSQFYSIHICPKCHSVLDHDKARYRTMCCYKCGHSNSSVLFDCKKVVVRDVYVNGVFKETVVKE
jgi:hypothetical protein